MVLQWSKGTVVCLKGHCSKLFINALRSPKYKMNVEEFIKKEATHISPEENLGKALELMALKKTRHLVVMDEERVVGILSDKDLAMFYDPKGMTPERWEAATVGQLMTKNPVAVGGGTPIKEAAIIMLKTAVSALPVINNGELIGILSDRDFVRHFSK